MSLECQSGIFYVSGIYYLSDMAYLWGKKATSTAAGTAATVYQAKALKLICRRQASTRDALPAMEATAMMGMAALGPKARLSTGSRIMDEPVPTTPLMAPAAMPQRPMSM